MLIWDGRVVYSHIQDLIRGWHGPHLKLSDSNCNKTHLKGLVLAKIQDWREIPESGPACIIKHFLRFHIHKIMQIVCHLKKINVKAEEIIEHAEDFSIISEHKM